MKCAAHVERSANVYCERALPCLDGIWIRNQAGANHARIVHEDPNWPDLVCKRSAGTHVGHVERTSGCATTNGLSRIRGIVTIEVDNHYLSPRLGQSRRYCPANPSRASRDQRDPSV